ncbi:MAG: metallophosphoesterase family protein [Clostridia bacterium]|nr:metallophosphoesterase family protein [Clostridia bacterium]
MNPIYIALICAGCVILIAAFVIFSNNCITVTRYSVDSPKAPEGGVKIVHLSDLHGKSFGKGNGRLLSRVRAQSPDLIAVTGDIIHKYRERDIAVALKTVKGLVEIAPVYYVSGNHEMRSTRYRSLREELIAAGAVVLDNERAEVCGVTLIGVNCAHIKGGKFFALSQGEGYKILLAHLPQYIDRYALAGYDLTLCGHAHGGQWRIPFTKIGVYSPGQGLFPKYISGVHSCGNMRQVISRGLGNSQCPLRLFNRPEIVVVSIKKS